MYVGSLRSLSYSPTSVTPPVVWFRDPIPKPYELSGNDLEDPLNMRQFWNARKIRAGNRQIGW